MKTNVSSLSEKYQSQKIEPNFKKESLIDEEIDQMSLRKMWLEQIKS